MRLGQWAPWRMSVVDLAGALLVIVQAIFAMLPAYAANPMAVLMRAMHKYSSITSGWK